MSTFGQLFRVTTFGESHCRAVGCIVDGVPPGFPLAEADIQPQLTRRRPGQSALTTPRDEKDKVQILSGVELGFTLGTPIALSVQNLDQRPHDYSEMDTYPRPSHADYTYLQKYSIKASSGGGRSSARETIGRVAAGAVAEKYLRHAFGVEIVAFVASVGEEKMEGVEVAFADDHAGRDAFIAEWQAWWNQLKAVTREKVDANDVRCPDTVAADRMRKRILKAKEGQDSIGGTVVCVIRNVPVGLGEPCFDKLEAKLAHAMMSIPATKAFEIGSGFAGTCIPGHAHNDQFISRPDGSLGTSTNFSGGVQGGISNGEDIYFRVAFKPPATIGRSQPTATYKGDSGVLAARGRHDPCVVPRAVAIVEAMAALVIMDAVMIQNARSKAVELLPQFSVPGVLQARITLPASEATPDSKNAALLENGELAS